MRINILILALLVAAGFLAAGFLQRSDPMAQNMVQAEEKREKIPDFQFSDRGGQSHKIADYAGKTIILNFWASWCAPCVTEFPILLEAVADASGSVVLIALSSDDNADSVEQFLRKLDKESKSFLKEENIIIGLDADKSITNDLFQTISLPETIIIGPDQRLRKKIIGRIETKDDLLQALK